MDKRGNRDYPEEQDDMNMDDEEIERYLAETQDMDDEEEEIPPSRYRKWITRIVASLLALALLGNLLAFLPRLYNVAAFEFLQISRELSQNEEIQQYKQAVVVVKADNRKGTGFNIEADGLIITNDHVIGNARQGMVHFEDGSSYRAEVIARSSEQDLAVLEVVRTEEDPSALPVLEMAKTSPAAGTPVYVIGNPLFFNGIANQGHATGRLPGQDSGVLMIDAPIYKGNSGSPVLDEEGKVRAVVFATTRVDHEGEQIKVGLAIPIEAVAALLETQE